MQRYPLVALAVVGIVAVATGAVAATAADPAACNARTENGVNCTCDLNALRPLQGAVGMGEVKEKASKIGKDLDKARRKLAADPIKVVRGPNGGLYITDHHHGARAWLVAHQTSAICRIEAGPSPADPEQFWQVLMDTHLVHLEDAAGRPIKPGDLPGSVAALPDDPYRTLAWMVREKDGFCRSLMPQKEFAEFVWADWLRGQPEITAAAIAAAPNETRETALALVESQEAAGLPGYRGDKPADFTCPSDDD